MAPHPVRVVVTKDLTLALLGEARISLLEVLSEKRIDFLNFVCVVGHTDLAVSPTMVISRKVSCVPGVKGYIAS